VSFETEPLSDADSCYLALHAEGWTIGDMAVRDSAGELVPAAANVVTSVLLSSFRILATVHRI
jgi:hypothetical protein